VSNGTVIERVTLRLPAELVTEARHAAVDLYRGSLNAVVEEALREYLDRRRPKARPRRAS
jgi:metal-responsive CopG/Arc/MetJ family transcriptional regulator